MPRVCRLEKRELETVWQRRVLGYGGRHRFFVVFGFGRFAAELSSGGKLTTSSPPVVV